MRPIHRKRYFSAEISGNSSAFQQTRIKGRDKVCRVIQTISVVWDASLSWEEINNLAHEIIQTWAWEGRTLGRIECLCEGHLIHIHTFEKPFITTAAREKK